MAGFVVLVSALPTFAYADEAVSPTDVAPTSDQTQTSSTWYGYQTLLVDASSISLGVGSAWAGVALGGLGLATYALGGPIVHAFHGDVGKAAIDFGLRVGAPLVGLGIGAGLICLGGACDFEQGGVRAAIGGGIGAGVGALAAIVVDAAVLAKEAPSTTRSAWNGKPIVAPQITAQPGGGAIGLHGAF